MTDLRPFIERVKNTLAAHYSQDSGTYDRFLSGRKPSSTEADVYGTADAANLIYTINEQPTDSGSRKLWIDALQSFQDAESGMFHGLHHHELHSTAFAISALELFDAKPKHFLHKLSGLLEQEALYLFMDQLDWIHQPWAESQKGSGIYACMVLSGAASTQWEDSYFSWLQEQADPVTGLWRKGCILNDDLSPKGAPLFHHIAGSFHYLFNLAYRNKSIPYPDRIIDSCLELYRRGEWEHSGRALSFMEVDWVYTISSCMKQTDYRSDEAEALLRKTSEPFVQYAAELGAEAEEPLEDLHSLCGAVSGLAAIQEAMPDLVHTDKPLQLVLNRRPFL